MFNHPTGLSGLLSKGIRPYFTTLAEYGFVNSHTGLKMFSIRMQVSPRYFMMLTNEPLKFSVYCRFAQSLPHI